MIGKQVDWVNTINEADDEGSPTSRKENMTGVVTGVTIVDGNPSIVVEDENGEKYTVDISSIERVYEQTPDETDEAAVNLDTTEADE